MSTFPKKGDADVLNVTTCTSTIGGPFEELTTLNMNYTVYIQILLHYGELSGMQNNKSDKKALPGFLKKFLQCKYAKRTKFGLRFGYSILVPYLER